jgi:hypothetical protein
MRTQWLQPLGERRAAMAQKPAPQGYHWVYTPYITLKTGQRIYASSYGKKVFAFLAKD